MSAETMYTVQPYCACRNILLAILTRKHKCPLQTHTQYNFTVPEATFHLPALTTKHECLLKPCTQYSLTVPAGTFCLPF